MQDSGRKNSKGGNAGQKFPSRVHKQRLSGKIPGFERIVLGESALMQVIQNTRFDGVYKRLPGGRLK